MKKELKIKIKKKINKVHLRKDDFGGNRLNKYGKNISKYFDKVFGVLNKFTDSGNGGNGNRTGRRNGNRSGRRNGNRTGNRSGRRNGNRTGNRSGRRNGGRTARRNSGRTNRGNGGRTARRNSGRTNRGNGGRTAIRTSRENKGNNMLNKIGKALKKGTTSIKPTNNSSNTLNNNNNNSNSSNSNNNTTPPPTRRSRRSRRTRTQTSNKPNKGLLTKMREDIVPKTELLCGACKKNELLLDRELLEKDYGITKRYINRLKKAEKYCDKCLKLCKYMKKTTESKKLRKDQDIFRARYPKVCKRNTYGNIKALEIKKALRKRLIKQYEKLNK